jgi:DNA repair protein RecN (Recombination protein N)
MTPGGLVELRVADLGVIEELTLPLGPGMTALTGETGAGKTLIVGAIELLMGGRADPSVVRPGATQAVVDGRFERDGEEVVLSRVVPAVGRSRAYLDGRPVTAARLAEVGRDLVDLHGQHDHQSLLSAAVQRSALDAFGDVEVDELVAARARVADIARRLESLGGDERARAHELDLARFQLAELDAAAVTDAGEDERLSAEEAVLADAVGLQEAAAQALGALDGEGGALESLAAAAGAMAGAEVFADLAERLAGAATELEELRRDLRGRAEGIEPDPDRLQRVQQRRRLLTELRRKYGDSLAEVLAFRDQVAARVEELEGRGATAAALEVEAAQAAEVLAEVEARVGAARRSCAPALAAAVESELAALAMERARLEVAVGPGAGDEVVLRLAANPGAPPLPLAKVASGGELARTMLALRLVLSGAPPTLVFDEVDAGIGGAAALAVGRSLAELGAHHQVLVVTHLPQVAAAADHQVQVTKTVAGERTTTTVADLDRDQRVVELSRMLSGTPDSEAARRHAEELLGRARLTRTSAHEAREVG